MGKISKWVTLVCFLILCFLIASLGSWFTHQSVGNWYLTLKKPGWNPPAWVFGPAWSILYILIAFAGWLIYEAKSSSERSKALLFYFIQLFLNLIWSYFFFTLRNPGVALMDIVLLWIFISLTIYAAWNVNRLASWLLMPYLLWVSYAFSLNLSIWMFNS